MLLEDSVMVAAFRPLTVLHPASGETVLALGTSRQLVFVGGPRPWLGRGSEYGKSISLGDGVKSKKDTLEVLLFLLLSWPFPFFSAICVTKSQLHYFFLFLSRFLSYPIYQQIFVIDMCTQFFALH